MAVHVNGGVFQLQNARCCLEMSAGRWEGGGLFILAPLQTGREGADCFPRS